MGKWKSSDNLLNYALFDAAVAMRLGCVFVVILDTEGR